MAHGPRRRVALLLASIAMITLLGGCGAGYTAAESRATLDQSLSQGIND